MIIAMTQYGGGKTYLPLYDVVSGTGPTLLEDGSANWEMVFTADCVIRFRRLSTAVDVFAVGGGAPGAAGKGNIVSDSNAWAVGGKGGKGGKCVTSSGKTLDLLTDYTVTIGGSGQATYAFDVTAESGEGSAGGNGAAGGTSQTTTNAGAGTDGTVAFGSGTTLYRDGKKYGAGGGGGSAQALAVNKASAAGGADGGGDGGNKANGKDGAANTGGGGGGGGSEMINGHKWTGGAGGSGIVIIRNARPVEEEEDEET